MKKKLTAYCIVFTLLVSMLTGCNTTQKSEEPKEKKESTKKEFVFAANGGVSMDPADNYSGWACIRNGVGETLFRLEEDLTVEPWLVDSYELSEDQLTWTLQLKKGITFQNGKSCDAEAVKKSLERTIEQNERAKTDLKVKSINADGLTLSISTTQPNPVFINNLCDPYACIIDTESDQDFAQKPIGTGPYMVEQYQADKETDLIPYKQYWDSTPKLSKIRVVSLADTDTMVMALQSGEIDAAYAMGYDGQAQFKDNPDYQLLTVATSRVYKLYFNFHNKHLANPNVRKALCMLADKKSYGSSVMNENGEPAVGAFPANSPFGKGLNATEFDVEGAKKLLAKEGYKDTDGDGILDKDGEKLSFQLVTYSSRAELPLLSAAFQSQCKEVGIEVNVEVSESVDNTLHADQFDISAYAYVTMPTGDPSSYLNFTMQTDGGANFGHYSNKKVDDLIRQLDTEFDSDKRGTLTCQAMQLVLDDDAYCFMDYLKMSIVAKSTITGLTPHPSDYYQINVNIDVRN